MSDLREAALELRGILESLGIEFAIGGSFASSIHGIARPTQNLDIISGISLSQVPRLAEKLRLHFYADAEEMRFAIVQRRAFLVSRRRRIVRAPVERRSQHRYSSGFPPRRQLSP
jgi:hypothetical protein